MAGGIDMVVVVIVPGHVASVVEVGTVIEV